MWTDSSCANRGLLTNVGVDFGRIPYEPCALHKLVDCGPPETNHILRFSNAQDGLVPAGVHPRKILTLSSKEGPSSY